MSQAAVQQTNADAPGAHPTGAAAARQWVILCVDDEPNILSALRRLFRARGYQVITADSGPAALDHLKQEHVDLVISDMRMPHMDGAELLEQVKEHWPEVARLLLTGYADINSTIAAINRGRIQRYITKPWNDDELLILVREVFERRELEEEKRRLEILTQRQNDELKALNAGLEEKVQLRTAELSTANDKLKKNYLNTIRVFSSMLEQRGNHLVGHARRVADLARRTARGLGLSEGETADVFIAGLLHDIGQIGLPDLVLAKSVPQMTSDEQRRYRLHPVLGEQTLIALEDMQGVAGLIRSHHERFDGQGFPDRLIGTDIPMGARILAIAEAYDDLQTGHIGSAALSASEARTMIMRGRETQFDPDALDAFLDIFPKSAPPPVHRPLALGVDDLKPGMVLARDFMSDEGVLLLAADHVLTEELIGRIRVFERRVGRKLLLDIRQMSPGTT